MGNAGGGVPLDDGVVVGPGRLQAVGEFFYGLHAGAIPDEESYKCCRQAAHHPNYILHACPFVSTHPHFVGTP